MILERGNMFSMWGKTDLFLFTSNPLVNKQGLAVMGRGIAKQVADRHPEIRKDFGGMLSSDFLFYPTDLIGEYGGQAVGYFMVKDHWREPARLAIIEASVNATISTLEVHASYGLDVGRIDLNFPGIGNGRLRREDVLPIIERLPDTVHVWEYGVG